MIGPDDAPAEMLQADQYAREPSGADLVEREILISAWIVAATLGAGLLALGFGAGLWWAAALGGGLAGDPA